MLVLGCAALGAAQPAAAWAHGEYDPAVRAAVDEVRPAVDGLSVRVVGAGAQRLQLVNRSARAVEVLASTGEPWLRVGPRGVEANVRSATWYASGNPDGVYRRPRGVEVSEDAPPLWRPVLAEPRWTWYAHELHPSAATRRVPPEVLREGREGRIGAWRIGLRAGTGRGAIAGHLDLRPVRGHVGVRLTSAAEPAPGVQVAALNARAPGLFVTSAGEETVVVDGEDGRPFARIRADRTEVDVASPTYREQPDFRAGPPAPAGTERPRWRPIPGGGATLSWIEPRARFPRAEPDRRVLASPRPSVLARWEVGLRVGDRRLPIAGETIWTPVRDPAAARARDEAAGGAGGATLVALGGGAVALAALALGALALRRRHGGARV